MPDMLTSLSGCPVLRRLTSTSMDCPGAIRRGAGKHNPVLLRFWVTKDGGSCCAIPPTDFIRRGSHAVNRGWRLRSGVLTYGHPLAKSGALAHISWDSVETQIRLFC